MEGSLIMHPDFQVESRSYDQQYRGSWRGYRLDTGLPLSDEQTTELASDCIMLWLPAGTPMHWATRTRPLRNNCLQLYWPDRWYTLSAFYEGRSLIHTYAMIIQPATIQENHLTYIDLDLSLLVEPDFSHEVLTQAEFEQLSETLNYSEETRIGALLALNMLTNSARLGTGLFAAIPHTLRQSDLHLIGCHS
jgi:protein associated with RNAse G/E